MWTAEDTDIPMNAMGRPESLALIFSDFRSFLYSLKVMPFPAASLTVAGAENERLFTYS